MTAEVMRLAVRQTTPETIRALIRTTVSGIEDSFNTVDRLQPRTRLTLALSLLGRARVRACQRRQIHDRGDHAAGRKSLIRSH
jgi:hypothetical protein